MIPDPQRARILVVRIMDSREGMIESKSRIPRRMYLLYLV